MSILGIITDNGLQASQDAALNEGFNLVPTRFGVSDVAGTLDAGRDQPTTGQFYTAPISSRVIIDQNTIKFVLTVPPNQIPAGQFKIVREVYLYINDSQDNEILFAVGQPTDIIRYNHDQELTLDLEFSIINLNLVDNFIFEFTQATEISEHNVDPNAHPEIRDALRKAGIFIPAGAFPFERRGQVFEDNGGNGVEFDGSKASGSSGAITFSATFNGTELNGKTIEPDGIKTTDELRLEFNSVNYPNTIEHDGNGDEVLGGGTITLSGGSYTVQNKDLVYKDVDGVYKQAIADSTIASRVAGIALLEDKLVAASGLFDIATGYDISTPVYLSGTTPGKFTDFNTNINLGLSLGDYLYFSGFGGDVTVSVSKEFDAVVTDAAGLGQFTTTQGAIDSVPDYGAILVDKLELIKDTINIHKPVTITFNNASRGWTKFPGVKTIYNVGFSDVPTEGTFRIEWEGQESIDLPFNATAQDFEDQFNLFSGHTGVTVTGDYTLGFTIEFADEVHQPAPTFLYAGNNETQRVGFSNIPNDGTIQFEHEGNTTLNFPWDDSSADLKAALEALPSIDSVDVSGSFADGYFDFEFNGGIFSSGLQPISAISVVMTDLDLNGTTTTIVGQNGLTHPPTPLPLNVETLVQGKYPASNLRDATQTPIDINVSLVQQGEPTGPDMCAQVTSDSVFITDNGECSNFSVGVDISNFSNTIVALNFLNVDQPILSGDKLPGINYISHNSLEYAPDVQSQLRILEHPTNKKRVVVSPSDVFFPSGIQSIQEMDSLIVKFEGAEIDFSTGTVYKSDGVTQLGSTFDVPAIAPEQWRWFSVALIPLQAEADGRIQAQLLVTAAEADGASKETALRAPFSGNKPLGAVALEGAFGDKEIVRVITGPDLFTSLNEKGFILHESVGSVAVVCRINGQPFSLPAWASAEDRYLELLLDENDNHNTVASKLFALLDLEPEFNCSVDSNRVTIEQSTLGDRPDAQDVDSNFDVSVLQQGTETDPTGIEDVFNVDIVQLGTGSGGGGNGSGGGFSQDLEFQTASFAYLSKVIFETDQDTKIANTDGSYNFPNKAWKSDAGEFFETECLLCESFFQEQLSVLTDVKVIAKFKDRDIDPTFEVSPNGIDFQEIEMHEHGETGLFEGIYKIDRTTLTASPLFEQAVNNDNLLLDGTVAFSQEFDTPDKYDVVRRIQLELNKLGNIDGNVIVKVVSDDGSGNPSQLAGAILYSIFIHTDELIAGDNAIDLDTNFILNKDAKLHLVVETDNDYSLSYVAGVNEMRVKVNNSPVGAEAKSYDGVSFTDTGTELFYTISGYEQQLRIKYTASEYSLMEGFGVYFGVDQFFIGTNFEEQPPVADDVQNGDVVYFDLTHQRYERALASDLTKNAAIGIFDRDRNAVVLNGPFSLSHSQAPYTSIYLSNDTLGGITFDPTSLQVGYTLDSSKIMLDFTKEVSTSAINPDGDIHITLQSNSIKELVLEAPNTTKFAVKVYDDGILHTEESLLDPSPKFKITKPDFTYAEIKVDNAGNLSVQSPVDDTGVITDDFFYIKSDNGTAWKFTIDDFNVLTMQSHDNKYSVCSDNGENHFMVKQMDTVHAFNAFQETPSDHFADPLDVDEYLSGLSEYPNMLFMTANRVNEYYQRIVARQFDKITHLAGHAVGDTKVSALDLTAFQAHHDATWVVCNGANVAGSHYEEITGSATIPNSPTDGTGLNRYIKINY